MKRLVVIVFLAVILAGCASGTQTENPAEAILDIQEEASTNVDRLNQRTDDLQALPGPGR
jgi:PBP1b-binding outer membrane lipoprotein LpoB